MADTIKGVAARFRARWQDVPFRARWRDDSGAVSVDWVVLSAAIIGVAFGTVSHISGATSSLASKVSTGVADDPVGDGN